MSVGLISVTFEVFNTIVPQAARYQDPTVAQCDALAPVVGEELKYFYFSKRQ